jgi:4-alpha-glucanotransferase
MRLSARRDSGILLHITSLPAAYGIGDLGPAAYEFADFLGDTGQRLWQILPLGPTDPFRGNSPYSSASAFAGSPLLISPDLLVRDGLLGPGDFEPVAPSRQVDFPAVTAQRSRVLRSSFERFRGRLRGDLGQDYERFHAENAGWLEDHAAFTAIKTHFEGRAWGDWPTDIRHRDAAALASIRQALADEVNLEKFTQFVFFRQWEALKQHCAGRGISIIGDIPIYVSDDSSDAWSNPEIFKLDDERRPTVIAGVPPDYFSRTGQLWGNPLYNWDALKATGYAWWVERFAHAFRLYDIVRVDHFRGFAAYWEVPAGEKTAVKGRWSDAPAEDFFETLSRRFPDLPIVAEDLGVITPDVKALMKRFALPGMRVLLFAFGDGSSRNPYLPHNYVEDCVVYTGTHDNNTVRGWFETEAKPEEKRNLARYLGAPVAPESLHWEMVRLAMMSVARLAVLPVQDILGLGGDARMNRPSTPDGNWGWRLKAGDLSEGIRARLGEMTETYGRGAAARAGTE